MRYAPRAILAGGLGFAVSCVAACGGGAGLLSGDQSIALSGQGDEINSAVESGNCGAAINASAALNHDVQNLPVTVDPTLRSNLSQGASTIAKLAAQDCRQHAATTTSIPTTTSFTTSTPSTSSSITTPTTSTTTTSTTTSSTTSSTATIPPTTGTSSNTTTSGGVGLGASTTTGTGTSSTGGTGPGNGNSGGNGGGG